MIEIVKENPCAECGIKGLYEHCEDKCVQYRKWYQYQQGRADAIEEIYNKLDEGMCFICEYAQEDCVKYCGKNGYEVETFKKWLEQLKE